MDPCKAIEGLEWLYEVFSGGCKGLYLALSEVGGSEGCQGLPSVTGKSFRFVRACARCALPSGNGPQIGCSGFSLFPLSRGGFPFSLFWEGLSLFP